MDKSVIEQIISAGIRAPSGDNVQPWRFSVVDNVIELFDVPEADQSLYNSNSNASYIAHGAAIENMTIFARFLGYRAHINGFPDQNQKNLVARITLVQEGTGYDSLSSFIIKRVTNRKSYAKRPLDPTALKEMIDCGHAIENASVFFVHDRAKIASISRASSMNERIVLENGLMHNFLFSHIRWTNDEEKNLRNGLFLPTLELKPPQRIVFRLYSHWPIARIFNFIGFSKIVANENARTYSNSSALGAITVDANSPSYFLNAGRLFERIWLTATKVGLSIQPLTGITLLRLGTAINKSGALSPKHINAIMHSYDTIKSGFSIKGRNIAFLFRLGYADAPSATSSRRKAIISWKNS